MVWYPERMLYNEKDKNYSFIVIIASFLCRATMFGTVYSSGIYYIALLDDMNVTKAQAAWVGSINMASLNVASIFSSMLYNCRGARVTALIGSIVASLGLIASSYATHIYFLYLSYGVVMGFGLGIVLVPLVVSVSKFFDKYRHISQSVASCGSSFGTFIGPMITERLISHYGWRGTMFISSAFVLNLGAIGMSLRDFDDDKIKQSSSQTERKVETPAMNLGILKNRWFIVACLTNVLVCFANSLIAIHISAYALWEVKLPSIRAAMLLSIVGGIGIFSRITFGILIGCDISPYFIVILAGLTQGVCTILLPVIRTFPGLIIYSVICGMCMSSNGGAVWPALLVDLLGEKNLANSFGIVNCMSGVGNLLGPPVAGMLLDYSGSYIYSFICGGIASCAAGIVIFPVWRKSQSILRKKKAKPDETYLVVEMVTSL